MRPVFTKKQMMAHVNDDEDFAEWYADDFMKRFLPEFYFSVSAQGKKEMIINGRHTAKFYNFQDSEAQAHFITLMWKIGPNFFEHPGFNEIALNSKQDDMQRIEAFYRVPKDKAAYAIMNPDDSYWYRNPMKYGEAP